MKKEISPAVMWAALAVVGVVVIFFGFRMLAPATKTETKGSETDMARVKAGEPLYKPPANAPVPQPGGQGGSGYNLHPPTH